MAAFEASTDEVFLSVQMEIFREAYTAHDHAGHLTQISGKSCLCAPNKSILWLKGVMGVSDPLNK
jgi:hypothetical protein